MSEFIQNGEKDKFDTREKLEEDVSSFNPLRGLRELANTSKHHTNAEWKKNLLRMVNCVSCWGVMRNKAEIP